MYARDIPAATLVNGTEEVFGFQNEELRKFPRSLFKGDSGTNGTNGLAGINGDDGIGVPAGGTIGQVLAKVDGTDYNTEWVDRAGSVSLTGR